jgi:anti-sigma factor RsiW
MRFLRRRREEIACRQVVELISDYIEGELPRSQRLRLEAHFAGCEHCTEYLAQMRATIRLTGTLVVEDLTPRMREDLLGVYRRWLAEDEHPAH